MPGADTKAPFGDAAELFATRCSGPGVLIFGAVSVPIAATAVPHEVQNFALSGSLCPQFVQWDMTAFLEHSEDLLPRVAEQDSGGRNYWFWKDRSAFTEDA